MNTKYILIFTANGISKELKYKANQKEQAISDFKNLNRRLDYVRLFSIDSEDESIWYDLGAKIK